VVVPVAGIRDYLPEKPHLIKCILGKEAMGKD
jgi:hypothetical protein